MQYPISNLPENNVLLIAAFFCAVVCTLHSTKCMSLTGL